MKAFKVVLFVVICWLCSYSAIAQCCCSGAEITLTDSSGVALSMKDVKITPSSRRGEASLREVIPQSDAAKFRFYVGCGDGTESLTIEYAGSTMRVRFKIHGDFGRPKTEIAVTHGDFVAELIKESEEDNWRTTIAVRPATEQEMKEIEPAGKETLDQYLTFSTSASEALLDFAHSSSVS